VSLAGGVARSASGTWPPTSGAVSSAPRPATDPRAGASVPGASASTSAGGPGLREGGDPVESWVDRAVTGIAATAGAAGSPAAGPFCSRGPPSVGRSGSVVDGGALGGAVAGSGVPCDDAGGAVRPVSALAAGGGVGVVNGPGGADVSRLTVIAGACVWAGAPPEPEAASPGLALIGAPSPSRLGAGCATIGGMPAATGGALDGPCGCSEGGAASWGGAWVVSIGRSPRVSRRCSDGAGAPAAGAPPGSADGSAPAGAGGAAATAGDGGVSAAVGAVARGGATAGGGATTGGGAAPDGAVTGGATAGSGLVAGGAAPAGGGVAGGAGPGGVVTGSGGVAERGLVACGAAMGSASAPSGSGGRGASTASGPAW